MQYTTAVLALMGTFASAAPSIIPRRNFGKAFNLGFDGNSDAPDYVAGIRGQFWVVGVRNNKMVITIDRANGNLFYQFANGSGPSVGTADTGVVITPGGTSTVPTSYPVELVNNNATSNTNILTNDSGVGTLHHDNGRFQVCRDTGGAGGFYVIFVADGQRSAADCADVELRAICSTTGVGYPLVGDLGEPQEVTCETN
jgi:hypothetical protein